MINIHFNITNPFITEKFYNLFCTDMQLTGNKSLEVEVLFYSKDLLKLQFSWTINTDHAGVNIAFGIFGYSLNINFYDHRHWDEDNNDWYNYQ